MKNGPITDKYGNTYWYKDDQYHRDGDLPAIELANGCKFWYVDGVGPIKREVTQEWLDMEYLSSLINR